MLEAYVCFVPAEYMACLIVNLHFSKCLVGSVYIYIYFSLLRSWSGKFLTNFLCDRDKVVVLVTKSMKNPRSALCKTAIMSSADIFKGYPEHLLDILDPLVHACFIACSLEY